MRKPISFNGPESLERTPPGQAAPRSGSRDLARWRSLLDTLIGAPVRLHRYRNMHAEVVEDALRAFDCGPERGARS